MSKERLSSSNANFAKIGIFVLIAVTLIVVGIGIAGSRVMSKRAVMVETYFSESITGLDVGSPVKCRGVPIGEVKSIGFVYSEYADLHGNGVIDESTRQIMVVMAIDPQRFGIFNGREPGAALELLIQQGLRVKVAMSGVTGLSFLELDYLRPAGSIAPPAPLSWKPHHFYIPSTLSTISSFKQDIDMVFNKLNSIDLAMLGRELTESARVLKEKLQALDLEGISSETTLLLQEVRESNQQLQQLLSAPEWKAVPGDIAGTAASARRTAERVELEVAPLVSSFSSLANQGEELLAVGTSIIQTNKQEVTDTVRSLRSTAQTLNRSVTSQQGSVSELIEGLRRTVDGLDRLVMELRENPAVLLYGAPPEPVTEIKKR